MISRCCVPRRKRPSKPKRFCVSGSAFEDCDWQTRRRIFVTCATGAIFWRATIRHYPTPNSSRSGYKLLIKPSPEAIQEVKRTLKGLWRTHVGSPTIALINALNPVIRGWSNYFRVGVSRRCLPTWMRSCISVLIAT